MSLKRTFGTLLITAAVGAFALVFTNPKKDSKNKIKNLNTRTDSGIVEKEGMFI